MQPLENPPDNHITKGGQWKKYDLVKFNFAHYVDLSPTDQARHLGGHSPYMKGNYVTELQKNSDLIGSYGHLENKESKLIFKNF